MTIQSPATGALSRLLKGSFVAAALVVAAMTPLHASAGPLNGVKILNLSGVTESGLEFGNMVTARNELTGAGATVTDVAIGAFTAANLVGIDILYVGLTQNGFNAGQVAAIDAYVAAGGGLVAVGTERACCFGPSWEQLSNSFGLVGLGGDRAAKGSPTTPTSPIVTGPFGTATSYQPAATGAFNAALPAGATSVWEGVDNNPIIVTLDVTGRAFFFADTNFMESSFIGNGDNAVIWGNAFAFTGHVDGVPEPETYALMLAGLGVVGFAARRRRAQA